jgi:hypothetical protein
MEGIISFSVLGTKLSSVLTPVVSVMKNLQLSAAWRVTELVNTDFQFDLSWVCQAHSFLRYVLPVQLLQTFYDAQITGSNLFVQFGM